jgi:hypothetical protein
MLRINCNTCPYCNNNIIASIQDDEFSYSYCIKCWKYIYYCGKHISYFGYNINKVISYHVNLYFKKTN